MLGPVNPLIQIMKAIGIAIWSGLILLLTTPSQAQFKIYPEADLKGRFRNESMEVRIDKLLADVQIDGDVATTTLQFHFAHSTPRRLEGDLTFAIPPGSTISSFQMSVNGKLRDGVMVAKDLARSVFDRLVRWRIDPGVVEWIDGEQYRLSVFPIDPKKQKVAVIRYEQEIPHSLDDQWLEFALPLGFPDQVALFELDVQVRNASNPPLQPLTEFPALQFQQSGDSYQANLSMADYRPLRPLELKISKPAASQVFTTPAGNDETYFYLRHFAENRAPKPKPAPERIGILWDVSTSSLSRDLDREILLLGSYLKALGDVELAVVKIGEKVSLQVTYQIKNGEWKNLRDELLNTRFDGGSRYSDVNLATYNCDEFLLFGDGLSTFGVSTLNPLIAPLLLFAQARV